jgi:hypothetical protein
MLAKGYRPLNIAFKNDLVSFDFLVLFLPLEELTELSVPVKAVGVRVISSADISGTECKGWVD